MTPPQIPNQYRDEVVQTQRAKELYETFIAPQDDGFFDEMRGTLQALQRGSIDQSEYSLVTDIQACIRRGMDVPSHGRVMIQLGKMGDPYYAQYYAQFCPPKPPPEKETDWLAEGGAVAGEGLGFWGLTKLVGGAAAGGLTAFFTILFWPSEVAADELPPPWVTGRVPYPIVDYAEGLGTLNALYDFIDRPDFGPALVQDSVTSPHVRGILLEALGYFPNDKTQLKAYITMKWHEGHPEDPYLDRLIRIR